MRPVYLDHNATTPIRPEVVEAMQPYLTEIFGNPNSTHHFGQRARQAVEDAREKVASFLGARTEREIVFTSCGTESDVLAIAGGAHGVQETARRSHPRILSTPIEHDAVRGTLDRLSRHGFAIDLAAVDGMGEVVLDSLKGLLQDQTVLATVMMANNEVGTLQPIKEIAALCRENGTLFHTDAVQAAGKVTVNVSDLGVDLLSISGHKINAPKGVGALYVREKVILETQMAGHQEKNRRGGTENVAQIVGLGVACELAGKHLETAFLHADKLRGRLIAALLKIPGAVINGHPSKSLPNCVNVSFSGVQGHQLVVGLDLQGVCVSSGPACTSGSVAPSHVLSAMGLDRDRAAGSMRASWGWSSTEVEIDRLIKILPDAVGKLRKVPAQV